MTTPDEMYDGMVERRQTLTPADIEVIRTLMTEMIVPHVCTLGMTPIEVWTFRQHMQSGFTLDQISKLRRAIAAFDRATSIIGYVVLVSIIGGVIALVSKGFWVTLFEGASKGPK